MESFLKGYAVRVERALKRGLPRESAAPQTLHRAMHYSLFAGGKRLRPALCYAAVETCGGDPAAGDAAACAVECVHTYSLIHDDLPAMDNDDLRRGRPTSHKVFGEGVAILAGDALLTFAFEILAQAEGSRRYPVVLMMRELASAAGSRHLIAGQVMDLEAEGHPASAALVRRIHAGKTAAMIAVSVRLGAMSADAKPRDLESLTTFGHSLGLAFQAMDDILDVTQTAATLGKTAGKDVAASKATLPSVLGLDSARREAARRTREAQEALIPLGAKADRLRAIAAHLLSREY